VDGKSLNREAFILLRGGGRKVSEQIKDPTGRVGVRAPAT
jgi:hypothetical protein